jgi:hypothetical protein
MAQKYDWICDNFAYILVSILSAVGKYQPEIDFIKEVFDYLNADMIVVLTFSKALFTFVLMKFFDVTIGRKVKEFWYYLINKVKNLW